jgi:hypothetical protein
VIDHEVAIAEAAMVPDQQLDGRVQMLALVGWRRVGRHQTVPVEHHRTGRVLEPRQFVCHQEKAR